MIRVCVYTKDQRHHSIGFKIKVNMWRYRHIWTFKYRPHFKDFYWGHCKISFRDLYRLEQMHNARSAQEQ